MQDALSHVLLVIPKVELAMNPRMEPLVIIELFCMIQICAEMVGKSR